MRLAFNRNYEHIGIELPCDNESAVDGSDKARLWRLYVLELVVDITDFRRQP